MIISSRQHPLVQLIRSLHLPKGRRDHGLFVIEGRNAVGAALRAGWPMREVVALSNEEELSEIALDLGLTVRRAAPEVLFYASAAQTALPIVAIGELPAPTLDLWPDFTLVLNEVADPGNVGTLWRAADAAGAGAVVSIGGADPFSPKVVRSAAGSTFHLPHARLQTNEELIALAKAQNVPLICAQAHGAPSCFDFAWPARAALVLGHERRGIAPEISAAAAFQVTIPTFGRAESLNAAMAGTVLLFSWAQSRMRGK